MILRITKALTDNKYKVTLSPENWSSQDLELMTKYGEPEVETGGTGSLLPAFSFSTYPAKIKTDFPFSREIDADAEADAEDMMDNWATEMQTRISTAMSTLRGNTDSFTGVSAVTI
jgi:hypothetical protein